MEQIIETVPSTVVYLDDIVVTGTSEQNHLENLRKLFERFRHFGVKLKRGKCEFFQQEVRYLGHIVNKDGLRPDENRLDAVKCFPRPKNREQLESFLGIIQYYSRHIPNVSTLAGPLNELRQKGVYFHWTNSREKAFCSLKEALVSPKLLTHFDDQRALCLSVDASEYGASEHRCSTDSPI